jgi:hypothetical protein
MPRLIFQNGLTSFCRPNEFRLSFLDIKYSHNLRYVKSLSSVSIKRRNLTIQKLLFKQNFLAIKFNNVSDFIK